jgi:hypothetical protein
VKNGKKETATSTYIELREDSRRENRINNAVMREGMWDVGKRE